MSIVGPRERPPLGASHRQHCSFESIIVGESEEVRLKPVAYSLESAYGSVKPSRSPEDFDELSRIARDAKAERTLQKMSAEP